MNSIVQEKEFLVYCLVYKKYHQEIPTVRGLFWVWVNRIAGPTGREIHFRMEQFSFRNIQYKGGITLQRCPIVGEI